MIAPTRSSDNPVGPRKPRIRWSLVLVWFLRLVAMAWIAKGLTSWASILSGAIENRATTVQAIVVYFSLIDIVAGVGLWLTANWGGVIWILAVTSYVTLGFFFPRVITLSTFAMAAQAGLVIAYLTLSWLASHEER